MNNKGVSFFWLTLYITGLIFLLWISHFLFGVPSKISSF
jgi:hypothetical protein